MPERSKLEPNSVRALELVDHNRFDQVRYT